MQKTLIVLGATIVAVFLLATGWSWLWQIPQGFHGDYLGLWFWLGGFALVIDMAVLSKMRAPGKGLAALTWLGLLTVIIVIGMSSWPLFSAQAYYELGRRAGLNDEAPLSLLERPDNLVRATTRTMAFQVVNKFQGVPITVEGQTFPLSSVYSLDEFNGTLLHLKTSRHQGLYWIFPIDFTGFFQWLAFGTAPGYALVKADDPNPVPELVLDRNFKYTRNAGWFDNLHWLVYSRHPGYAQGGAHLELDPDDKAWWVVSLTLPRIGPGGYDLARVVLVDPETGAERVYEYEAFVAAHKSGELSWISRVVPEPLAASRIDWVSSLADGFWNSLGLPGRNVLMRTGYEGSELWFLPMGERNVWLTGMTSLTGNDQSIVNFTLMDTITGELWRLPLQGTDENGAVAVVQGALGAEAAVWTPVLPNPVLVGGLPYWHVIITDSQHIYRRSALLRIDQPLRVTFGESWADARNRVLRSQGAEATRSDAALNAGSPADSASSGASPSPSSGRVTLELSADEAALLRRVLESLQEQLGE